MWAAEDRWKPTQKVSNETDHVASRINSLFSGLPNY